MSVVQVGDIKDAEAFVKNVVLRTLRKLQSQAELEEMVAEGLVVLYDLWRRYDPSKDLPSKKVGHKCRGPRCCVPSFAGYASFLLPPKMLDAWHAQHPEHLLRTQPDGKRRYVYLQEACSLDEPISLHGGAHGVGHKEDVERDTLDRSTTRHVGMFMPVPEQTS